MNTKWHEASFAINDPSEKIPLPIINDGAIATQKLGDGRFIPALIIDATARPDVQMMITSHKYVLNGDVVTGWTKTTNDPDRLSLVLNITAPTRCFVVLEFYLPVYAGVVDTIIQSQSIYLQCGNLGDRISSTLDEDRVLIEVPSRHFRMEWDRLFLLASQRLLRSKGLTRQQARRVSEVHVKEWRETWAFRMRHSLQSSSTSLAEGFDNPPIPRLDLKHD